MAARRPSMPDEWIGWDESDPTRKPLAVAPGLYLCEPPKGWSWLAQWASQHAPGMWFPKDWGLTWSRGATRAWLVSPSVLPSIQEARSICLGLGVEPGWSVGSCAFSLLKSLGIKQYPEKSSRDLVTCCPRAYQCCTPGVYADAVQYDVSSYYYSLWSRLPSLRVHCYPDGSLIWQRTSPAVWDRHRRICEAVAPHKWLRNALVGCAQGSRAGAVYWHGGERKVWRGTYGPLAPAAWLVVRSGYDLTRAAAEETDAVYSHTDSVICPADRWPLVWEDYGLAVREEARGEAEVCGTAIYRVGRKATHLYNLGSRWPESIPREAGPATVFYRSWLSRSAA